jgi:hypothetical protein
LSQNEARKLGQFQKNENTIIMEYKHHEKPRWHASTDIVLAYYVISYWHPLKKRSYAGMTPKSEICRERASTMLLMLLAYQM